MVEKSGSINDVIYQRFTLYTGPDQAWPIGSGLAQEGVALAFDFPITCVSTFIETMDTCKENNGLRVGAAWEQS